MSSLTLLSRESLRRYTRLRLSADPPPKGNAAAARAIDSNPSLRAYLLEAVEPAEIWRALKAALEGTSEAARVSAAKVLLDALAERQAEREHAAEVAGARERLLKLLQDRRERRSSADRARHVCELLDEIAADRCAGLAAEHVVTAELVREMRDRLEVVAAMKATPPRHTGGGLVRQSERLAVPRDAAIEI